MLKNMLNYVKYTNFYNVNCYKLPICQTKVILDLNKIEEQLSFLLVYLCSLFSL